MKINNYTIPPECRRISVEASDNSLIITFEPESYGDFYCEQTDHVESIPRLGDLAVFWEDDDKSAAIIARTKDEGVDDLKTLYQAANDVWYSNAMRFRSDEQYKHLTGR